MKHLVAAFLLLPLVLHAEEFCRVFLSEGMDSQRLHQVVQEQLAATPDTTYELITLPAHCTTTAQARLHARAIECGVSALPALVLADEQGPYATLPLSKLSPETLQEARANKNTVGRRTDAQKHRLEAHLFLLCARIALETPDTPALDSRIAECRTLLAHPHADSEHRQFIGLRLLYPLLMEQYKRGYQQGGAHTPATEAKLLEAIAALEAARDINADTPLGKQAFAERERLRAARRKSRQYE